MLYHINTNIFNNIESNHEPKPMQTGRARSWLGEYHWVSLPIKDQNQYQDIRDQAIDWCRTQFGRGGSRWFGKDGKFYFKDEKDMSMFILRWS